MRFLFVFGAGASAAEGAPTIENFLSTAYRLYGKKDKNNKFGRVWKFIQETFGKPILGEKDIHDNFPTIDEIFSLIDYCILTKTSLNQQDNIESILEIKKLLISLMSHTLKDTTKSNNKHLVFLKRHISTFGGCDIISLNYDTLLDNALASIVAHDKIDYGFASNKSFLHVKNHFRLFKLHGSLNWGSCPLCKSISIFNNDIAHELDNKYECKECSYSNLEPVIITPTLLKDYNFIEIHNVWNSAFKVITKCNVIVFIGYSLNPADIAIIHLLKRAISVGNKLEKIVVIDKSKSKKPHTLVRYTKIFNREIKYFNGGFKEDLDIAKILS